VFHAKYLPLATRKNATTRYDGYRAGASVGAYTARVQTRLKRVELDQLARHYALHSQASATLLDLADARPGRTESLTFLARCFRHAGVLSLGSSVVFFVAANWSRIAVFGRFALLEILLVGFVVLALLRPPPRFVGRAALLLAFITTGALLALFGQTYQTGADVYELFLGWALLGLPLVVAAQWGPTSAAWICVLDLALCLFCGWNPRGGFLWVLFDGERFTTTHAVFAATVLNLGLWIAFERLQWRAVPGWVRRLVLFFALCFVSWLGFIGVFNGGHWGAATEDWLAIGGSLAALAGVIFAALAQRRDVYPLALAAGALVFLLTCWIARWMADTHEAVFFVMALWLITASTLCGRGLMLIARAWRGKPA
jgi:uncharacterized membrane protein